MTDSYLVASVAVEKTEYHFDILYDYVIPQEMMDTAKVGCRVMISFGKGSLRQGMIIELKNTDNIVGLKKINSVLDKEPVMSDELILLAKSMKERCYCTFFDACNTILPKGLSIKVMYSYSITEKTDETDTKLSDTEKQIIGFLRAKRLPTKQKAILKNLGLKTDDILVKMTKKGLLSRTEDSEKRLKDATVRMIKIIKEDIDTKKLTPRQNEILEILNTVGEVSKKEICYFTGAAPSTVDTLVKKGICEYFDEEPPKANNLSQIITDNKDIVLTDEQEKVYNSLVKKYKSNKASVSLLYGITGSGKTSVFMKLIDRANEDNKGVICMVPEISLTPQLLAKFNARYGNRVAVFHSGLSLSKRLKEWKRVKNGEANIAVGTRSAVFAPLENIGLIVMDEEQEHTYKSSSTPRFHACELAKIRCNFNKCILLLSSATPSVESYYFAEKGRYSLETLSTRYGNAILPKVVTVDMNEEQQKGNMSNYSSVLIEALQNNLKQGHQSIILLNRRGHNTFVSCEMCNQVISCPNCSVSLTYHSANNRLMCHYCGYSIKIPNECPSCHYNKLRFSGTGTQRAEQELKEIFPAARILRLDTDSTMKKFAYEKKLTAFQNNEYDIMLGTQMVAKGLDFPKVTLVGVLSADQELHSGDYRSYEHTFSLLTQVVGRSGRGNLKGRAVIQTYEPENSIIELSAKQDYKNFFKNEICLRRAMLYPPFADICVVVFVGCSQEKTKSASEYFSNKLKNIATKQYSDLPMRVLCPSPAVISKINNKFRYQIIMKFKNTKRFREMLSFLLIDFGKNKVFSDITAYADINPDSII